MKKIVGIIGAALLASSIFAVDFSAGVRLQGSLFNFNDGAVTIFEEHHENQFYHKPISFAISSDRAGGQLKLTDVTAAQVPLKNKDNQEVSPVITDAWSIWFKPVDALKITVGRWSTNLNQEHIGWCNTDSGIETDGYALSLGLDSFSWDLFLASGDGKWFVTIPKEGDAAVAELYTKFQFGADFGTVNAMFNAINTFKDFRFGAGLNLAGLPVGLWFNVIGIYAAEDFQRIRVEADVSGNVDSLGYELFLAGGYNMATNVGAANAFTGVEGWHVGGTYGIAEPEAFVGFYAKLSFPIGNLGGFVELKDGNVLAKDFNMTINPGFTANVGGCEIKAGINLTAAKKVVVDVPVEFAINF